MTSSFHSAARARRWSSRVALGLFALTLWSCESGKPPGPQPAPEPAAQTPPATTARIDQPPATGYPVRLPTRPLGEPTGTFVDRDDPSNLRLVSYNILWNSIFVENNPRNATRFARVMAALDPDILALQEIGLHPEDRGKPGARKWTAADVVEVMNLVAPLPDDASWHAHQGNDNVVVSKHALALTDDDTDPPGQRRQALALVDLPDERFDFDFYVFNNHYKCCGGEDNDPKRQQQSDAIVSWIRDARTPGGRIDLPAGTAMAVVGDLNIVGGFQPVQTLIDGDIADEERYGADFPPDWDDTGMVDAHPLHNVVGPEDYTWRNDTDRWAPGRLDYVVYTDSVLEVAKSFVLDTTAMTDEDLKAAGLERLDITVDDVGKEYDHLPLVVDFRAR